ncbi:MAG: hypothetical protein MRERC_1c126 [Mycoplasmataceae bacterium RC_NB112A]|nr:MAG: hypothetical protein MRERC_1c126 [Mycoplasmataceae bacterium RC_NB112A]
MNYLSIERAREKYIEYLEEVRQLENQINRSLSTLKETLSLSQKKEQTWQVLKEKGENIYDEVEKELYELKKTRFSAESDILEVQKNDLIDKYQNLIRILKKQESTIAEQMRKRIIPIIPFRQELPEENRCYYCKIDISGSFSYQLGKEVQIASNVRVVEGARFCSQECLYKYCEKYRKWNHDRQIKREKHQSKIACNKRILTQLQEEETNLQKRINDLERREQVTKDLYDEEIREKMLTRGIKKPSRWQRFLQKLGIKKTNSTLDNLQRIKKLKQECKLELVKKQDLIGQVLLKLEIDKKFEEEWDNQEKNFFRLAEKKEEEEN